MVFFSDDDGTVLCINIYISVAVVGLVVCEWPPELQNYTIDTSKKSKRKEKDASNEKKREI